MTDVESAVTQETLEQQEQEQPVAASSSRKKKKKVRTLPRKRVVRVLSVGMEVNGKVKRISDFGAFVGIGVGRDGLLHISQLSTGRVHKVSDVVKEGDEVTVWIKDLDREKNRISLTMIPPGTKTISDLAAGELVNGTVTRLTNYGAFIDIGLDRDALLHVKEMSEGYVAKPEDVVKVGEEVEVRIIGVDQRRGRVDLSLKGLRPAAEGSGSTDYELVPASVDDIDEDIPSLMELAFRQAVDGGEILDDYVQLDNNRKRGRKSRRSAQSDIIDRTLRYHEERG
ncbi:MAG: S1 RNA-binding domain-containing protein [Chloroflexota bacterium]|nr:S1 RNA-binding domain-containing protein [Chloroflexota bacterium]